MHWARSALRRLSRRREPRGVVLLYHRVATLAADPWSLAVTPARFAEHLAVLARHAHPMSLGDLVAAAARGAVPPRAVAVTFDDGYADNLHAARPLLARYDVPATVFVTSGLVDERREFWWDELERIVLASPALPRALTLRIGEREHTWALDDVPGAMGDASAWRASTPPVTARQTLYLALWRLLHASAAEERRRALDALLAWSGAAPATRGTHRVLDAGEVGALARDGLVEVGAHSVTHASLAALPATRQRDEIVGSVRRLAELTGRPVTSFAYPFGKRADFTEQTAALVRDAGCMLACANVPGGIAPGVDPFQLPRVCVYDWDGDRFARFLSQGMRRGWA